MSWLDANEYFLMEAVARDRLDDIRRTIDVAVASGEGADETPPREASQPARARPECGAVEPCGFRTEPPALGVSGRASS
jgi:hypothetical protein